MGKRLDKKAKVDFKISGVMNWETSNHNTHSFCPSSQELKAIQSDEVKKSNMTKKSGQKVKYVKNKKRFLGKTKSIFHHF